MKALLRDSMRNAESSEKFHTDGLAASDVQIVQCVPLPIFSIHKSIELILHTSNGITRHNPLEVTKFEQYIAGDDDDDDNELRVIVH